MKLFRITNRLYANNFSGKGASFEDGARWNSAGHPVIYFGLNMATAMVEAANYLPNPRLVPVSHCKATYELPETVSSLELAISNLPDDWQDMPYPRSTQMIGDEFLMSQKALMLKVPSVAVGAGEYAVAVVNPQHPDIHQIKLTGTEQPVYSTRMFSGLS